MLLLLIAALLPFPVTWGLVSMRTRSQLQHDTDRQCYVVTWPSDMSEERPAAFLRATAGTFSGGVSRLSGVPSLVFETLATSHGISHRIQVPTRDAEYLVSQLRTLIPGITVAPDDERPIHDWTAAVNVGMTRPQRRLQIANQRDVAASMLASVQALGPEEVVLIQWVLSPAPKMRPPVKGDSGFNSDELEDRREKLKEPNFFGIGRIATVAKDKPRARHLIDRVRKAMAGAHSHANTFDVSLIPSRRHQQEVNQAHTPFLFPAQFSVPELGAVLSWPIGSPFVAGLPQGATRHLHATEDVPRDGWVIGRSNYPGHERPIAIDYGLAVRHTYLGGKTGVGKTVVMSNGFGQAVAKGYGAIVIDLGGGDANETMYSRAVNLIPSERIQDTVVMDVNRSLHRPIGFNVLDQGKPRVVVDQLTDIFSHLYPDTKGVWTRELLFHGLYTLAEHPGHSFVDLTTLLMPRSPEETAWADQIVASVSDPELREFWKRWKSFSSNERERYAQPLLNRAWQLISRPETRNIIGQSTSSFQMRDVLEQNKILLISLAGLPTETSTLLGTLLMNAIWNAAQSLTPEKPNFLYLDEFQLLTRLPMGLDDMLARARKHKLGVTLATQFMEDLPSELQHAVVNNTLNRVIFQSSAREARTWQSEFGRQYVDENDFTRIRKYEAIAQVGTHSGVTTPVTIAAAPPMVGTGNAREAVAFSDRTYGRDIKAVQEQIVARRTGEATPKAKRPPIGTKEWGSN